MLDNLHVDHKVIKKRLYIYRYNDGDDGEIVSEDPTLQMSSLDQAKKSALNRTKYR